MPNISRLPRPVLESYEWQESGSCHNANIENFFTPEGIGRAEKRRRERAAKQLCARCPVRIRCLEHALSVPEPFGVWGGFSANERRRLLAERAA